MIRRIEHGINGFFPAPSRFERQVRTSFFVLLILLSLASYSAIVNAILHAWVSAGLATVSIGCLMISALLHRFSYYTLARVLMLVTTNLLLFFGSYFQQPVSNVSLILLSFVGLPFIVFSWRENRALVASLSALPLVLWNVLIFTNYGNMAYVETELEISKAFGYWHSILVFFFVALEFAYFDYVAHNYSRALHKSLAAEEKAGRVKTAFLSSMNHEIRTPLNAIIGSAELLRAHPQATPDIRRLANYIDQAGQDILTMTDKSLTYTRLISGPLDVTLQPEDPMKLARAELEKQDAAIQAKSIKVETKQICHLPVMADANLLSQVLAQLIDNAVKYLPEKGTIRVIVAKGVDQRVRISIKDNGPGIPMEKRDQVFLPFERLEQSLGTESGGGVGLTIAKVYVDAMGGEIGIMPFTESGAHVWVELPSASPTTDSDTAESLE